MKIAVTSTGTDLESAVDARFGRCTYFIFVDTDTMAFEAIENPNSSLGSGAGIQSVQFIAGKGVGAILTGNCGPNAFQTFRASGIQVFVGVSGIVKDAIEQFKSGTLSPASDANVASHFGAGLDESLANPVIRPMKIPRIIERTEISRVSTSPVSSRPGFHLFPCARTWFR